MTTDAETQAALTVWEYRLTDSPKMVRETLCVAQSAVANANYTDDYARGHIERLGRLIDECDRHRPLGVGGKHNDLHTPTCGCDGHRPDSLTPPRPTVTEAENIEWTAAEREAVREVLQAHLWHHTATTHCSCGWWEPLAQLSVVRWTEHVADEVAEAQAPFVAERERQAAARALREFAAQRPLGGFRREVEAYADRIEREDQP